MLASITARAFTFDDIITFKKAAEQAKSLTLIVCPTYAPDLVVGGKHKPWGVSIAGVYPILDVGVVRTLTGLRLDYLADRVWEPGLTVTPQIEFTLGKKVDCAVFGIAGAIFPFNQGTKDSVGAIYGVGFGANLLTYKSVSFGAGFKVEKWTPYDGVVWGVGCGLTVKPLNW